LEALHDLLDALKRDQRLSTAKGSKEKKTVGKLRLVYDGCLVPMFWQALEANLECEHFSESSETEQFAAPGTSRDSLACDNELKKEMPEITWVWINTYENTIFRGMNIHKSQLF